METSKLLENIRKISEFETEILWYLNEYPNPKLQPWVDVLKDLHIDLDIVLPKSIKIDDKKLLVGLTILIYTYELEQAILPGTYRIYIEKYGYLDQLEDYSQFMLETLANLINHYYTFSLEDKLKQLEKQMYKHITDWNYSNYVLQEMVKYKLNSLSIEDTANSLNIPEDTIPMILGDLYERMNKKKLRNLETCIEKIELLYQKNPGLRKKARHMDNLINEMRNGGENMNTSRDLFPLFYDYNSD